MSDRAISPVIGPGSQPGEDEDLVLDYMEMPQGMMTYHMPALPEKDEISGREPAMVKLIEVLEALKAFKKGAPGYAIQLKGLDPENIAFVDDALGEGEVSIIGGPELQAQESVLAGVWRVRSAGNEEGATLDWIEVAHVPAALHEIAFAQASPTIATTHTELNDQLFSAPSLLAEVNNVLITNQQETARHAINLSLLPHTEEDLLFLDEQLGQGHVHILSRGYGNCRISSTLTRNVWWVRYYNSQDVLILNSLEVAPVPEVAFAAIEDIHDSAQRLQEILEVYQ